VAPEHFPDALPVAEYRERARYRQLRGRHGIGVIVERAVMQNERGREWSCVATDGQRFRYLDAVLPDVSPFAGIPTQAVEAAVEKRAGDYPDRSRLQALVNASPIVLTLDELGGEY
jgi:hypothetical protein